MAAPANSYLITNRSPDKQIPPSFDTTTLNNDGETLSYLYWAVGANPSSPSAVDYCTVWKPALLKDIEASATGALNSVPGVGQLIIFIHGYGNKWADALGNLYSPGGKLANLAAFGPFPGPIVEFDWPSTGLTVKDVMGLAQLTGQNSLPQLAQVISDARTASVSALNVVIVCHSMGNYALQQMPLGGLPAGTVQQCVLIAPMLSVDAFNAGDASPTPALGIVQITAGSVTVYYSHHDDVLPLDANPPNGFPQLGVTGPLYAAPAAAALYGQVLGVDCSAVVNSANSTAYGSPQVHQSYFYIPQVMQDIAATILANDRTPFQSSSVGFQMQALPFVPTPG